MGDPSRWPATAEKLLDDRPLDLVGELERGPGRFEVRDPHHRGCGDRGQPISAHRAGRQRYAPIPLHQTRRRSEEGSPNLWHLP